ncbi:MAG: hypothetical protein ACYCQJ_01685 [Nitrososphaerales archaeon]
MSTYRVSFPLAALIIFMIIAFSFMYEYPDLLPMPFNLIFIAIVAISLVVLSARIIIE